jgi:hypothetical protein
VIIIAVFVIYLVFYEVTLYRGQSTDNTAGWEIVRVVFNALYRFAFYSTLVIASSGWCLLNVEITPAKVVFSAAGVAIYVVGSSLSAQLNVGYWNYLIAFGQLIGVWWIVYDITKKTKQARAIVMAHLMVIDQDGIDPSTTPIYQKYILYRVFVVAAIFAFVLLFLVDSAMILLDAPNWIAGLLDDLVQLGLILFAMFLYRPRGSRIDAYMQADVAVEGGSRNEVLLEDLDSFSIDAPREGRREWEDGMGLPLEPVLISSREQKSIFQRRTEQPYEMTETHNVSDEVI